MPAITVIALIDQINVLNSDTSPHMISHSYVHPCTYESTHAYTSVASVDPLWGQEHQWPLRFFCPMVSCWADISVCSDDSLTWCLFGLATCFHLNRYAARRKRRGWRRRRRAEPSGALTWRTRADNGRPVEAEREKKYIIHIMDVFVLKVVHAVNCLQEYTYVMKSLHSSTNSFCLVYLRLEWTVFCGSLTHQHCQGKANKMSSEWNES